MSRHDSSVHRPWGSASVRNANRRLSDFWTGGCPSPSRTWGGSPLRRSGRCRGGFREGRYPPDDFLDLFRRGFRLSIELFRRFLSLRFEGLRSLADLVEGGEKFVHLAQRFPDFAGDVRRNVVRRGRLSAYGEVRHDQARYRLVGLQQRGSGQQKGYRPSARRHQRNFRPCAGDGGVPKEGPDGVFVRGGDESENRGTDHFLDRFTYH